MTRVGQTITRVSHNMTTVGQTITRVGQSMIRVGQTRKWLVKI